MKIRISISKVTALKAGKDRYGPIVIDVPAESLTLEQRNKLAEHWAGNDQPAADFYLDNAIGYKHVSEGIAEATPDTVRLILDRLIEIRRKNDAEKAAEAAEKKKELAKKTEEFLKEFAENPRAAAVETRWGSVEPVDILRKGIPELANALQWAKTECEKIKEERQQAEIRCKEIEKEQAAKAKAQKESAETVLREWAMANGSDLLKARIADKFEWIGLAEKEFAASTVAELGEQIEIPEHADWEELERTTPTLPEIQRLREVRKSLEGKPATAELVWATYEENEYNHEIKRAELKVTVTTPTDRDVDFYYPAVK